METKTKVENFIEVVTPHLNEEQLNHVIEIIETYDKKIIEDFDSPVIIVIGKYGDTYFNYAREWAYDPWKIKNFFKEEDKVYVEYCPDVNRFKIVDNKEAGMFLYENAKYVGFPVRPIMKNIEGSIIPFDELVGTIPIFMREIIENANISISSITIKELREYLNNYPDMDIKRTIDDSYYFGYYENPIMKDLQTSYNNIVKSLVWDMHRDSKRVPMIIEGKEEYIDIPIKNIRIYFGGFDNVSEKATQTTAYYCAEDVSENFNPEPKYNWHLQEVSRVLSNGAICLSVYEENGIKKIRVSTHT